MPMQVFARVAILTAAMVGFATPSLAAGVSTGDANVSRAASEPAAQDSGRRVAASCEWVYREKLCQTEWGRRKYPGCC
jgi:hypothetical protein